MTAAEWLACTDTYKMLEFLRGKASDRKLRLFAVACCRRIGHLFTDERSRSAVEVAERYAEGEASDDELNVAGTAACAVSISLGRLAAAAEAAGEATWGHDAYGGAYHAALATYHAFFAVGEVSTEAIAQCDLLRDVIGNPFRIVTIDSNWLRLAVVASAQAIYEERAFERMPELGEALERAGCSNTAILDHCRQPGEHVRGCWVVDLILGKS
jgi:hypothetical protein